MTDLSKAELMSLIANLENELAEVKKRFTFTSQNAERTEKRMRFAMGRLRAELTHYEINPPAGSQAQVYRFTPEGLTVLRDAIYRTGSRYGNAVTRDETAAVNQDLNAYGGVPATLLNPATGGSVPRPKPTSDKAQVIVAKLLERDEPDLAIDVLHLLADALRGDP